MNRLNNEINNDQVLQCITDDIDLIQLKMELALLLYELSLTKYEEALVDIQSQPLEKIRL